MAGIDDIISGVGGNTRADFSHLSDGFDAYNNARDQKAKNDLRDAFKGGVPTNPDGTPDFATMAKTLYQKGGLNEGTAAANLALQQGKIRYGQDSGASAFPDGNTPQQPIVGPSTSRNSVSIDPTKRADAPQADQPTVMKILAAQGIPNDQLGAASESLGRQLGVSPTDPINPNDPQVRNVLVPAVQRLKGIGQVQPQPQPQPQQPPQVAQQPPQAQPVAQVAPQSGPDPRFVGLVPPGRTPEQQVTLLSRAITSGNLPPEQVKLYQNRIDAITKAMEPTSAERDFGAATRNPKLDDYVAQQEAAKASAKGVAEADVKEQNDLIAQGKQASSRLTTLNTMSNIIASDPNINLGFGGPTALKVKMALESLGVPVPDLSGPQAIQKLNASLASEMAKSLTSRTTQFEFRTFLGNNPGLELDKSGNERLIGIFSQLAKREVDLGKLARANRDNWTNWDQVVENYDKKNPMRDPVTKKVLSTDSIIAPGPAKASASASIRMFSSPSEVHAEIAAGKLKKGDTFKDSSGIIRTVP